MESWCAARTRLEFGVGCFLSWFTGTQATHTVEYQSGLSGTSLRRKPSSISSVWQHHRRLHLFDRELELQRYATTFWTTHEQGAQLHQLVCLVKINAAWC